MRLKLNPAKVNLNICVGVAIEIPVLELDHVTTH